MVAQRTAAPIVPIAIDNCSLLVPVKGWRPRPAVLRAKVGKPIDATGLTRDELMRRVRDEMIDLHLALGGKGGDKSNVIARDEEKVVSPQSVAV